MENTQIQFFGRLSVLKFVPLLAVLLITTGCQDGYLFEASLCDSRNDEIHAGFHGSYDKGAYLTGSDLVVQSYKGVTYVFEPNDTDLNNFQGKLQRQHEKFLREKAMVLRNCKIGDKEVFELERKAYGKTFGYSYHQYMGFEKDQHGRVVIKIANYQYDVSRIVNAGLRVENEYEQAYDASHQGSDDDSHLFKNKDRALIDLQLGVPARDLLKLSADVQKYIRE